MKEGLVWKPEVRKYTDRKTGVKVTKLTDYKGHSHHLYFTNPGWYAGGRKLLFGSDRDNKTNLFSVDLDTYEITQLTDLADVPHPREVDFLVACVNPVKDEAYYWYDRNGIALDLTSLESRVLWELPEGFVRSMINCTADGRHICVGIHEDYSDRFEVDLLHGYVGFSEYWEALPLSQIIRIAVDGGKADILWEENYWIGHVNTSPTQQNLLTFCHEGPWDRVDNRIWMLDMNTAKAWPVRPREKNEVAGHEYWYADGIHIGYHGAWDGNQKFFGKIKYDNTGRTEVDFPHETGHIHSNDMSLVVGDGGPVIRLWKWNGNSYDGPRVLCEHLSSFNIQHVHAHPRFSQDGSKVVFTSDRTGYGNVYIAEVPEYESLPGLEELYPKK